MKKKILWKVWVGKANIKLRSIKILNRKMQNFELYF